MNTQSVNRGFRLATTCCIAAFALSTFADAGHCRGAGR